MASHIQQIYKMEKKTEQQETTIYLEPTYAKQKIKSKKPLSLTQRGELLKKS